MSDELGIGQGLLGQVLLIMIQKCLSMAWKRYPSVFDEVTAYVNILAQRA